LNAFKEVLKGRPADMSYRTSLKYKGKMNGPLQETGPWAVCEDGVAQEDAPKTKPTMSRYEAEYSRYCAQQ